MSCETLYCPIRQSVQYLNDGKRSDEDEMLVNDGEMLVNDGEMLVNDGEMSV